MSTLSEFIAARLDEDEATARHEPGRALREVTAKRAILAAFNAEREHGFGGSGFTEGLEFALRHTATAWSDHRDYREEWRPDGD